MKKGLILEGGGMRGMFTAGVTDVMMENSVLFDGIIGVSAGAAFGCNCKSGQTGRALRYNTRYCSDPRYCGLRSLITTGNLYNTDFCYNEVPMKLDVFDFETFENNPTEFYVVCTDVENGKAIYHKYGSFSDNGFDWIRASASLPLVSEIVEIGNLKLLDGGMTDSIPVKYFESIGYRHNVVILTQPSGYRKKPNNLLPLIKMKYRRYPKLVEAIENRHIMYNEELDYINDAEKSGRLFVIRPDAPLNVKRAERDPEKLKKAYEHGRKTALRCLPELLDFLSK